MKICIILTTRGNYAKFKRFIELAWGEPGIELDSICDPDLVPDCGGFLVNMKTDNTTNWDIAIKSGKLLSRFVEGFKEIKPDLVMLVGDRWETHSAATAAYLCGIPIAHLEGGEISGSLDNHLRYAISELSTYHFPCTDGAA